MAEEKKWHSPTSYKIEKDGQQFIVDTRSKQMTPVDGNVTDVGIGTTDEGPLVDQYEGPREQPILETLLNLQNQGLFQKEFAHSEIDGLINENEEKQSWMDKLSNINLSSLLGGIPERLASKLIGQHESTGYIPGKGDPEIPTSRDVAQARNPLIVGLFDKIQDTYLKLYHPDKKKFADLTKKVDE